MTGKNSSKRKETTTVVADDPQDRKGALKSIGDSQSDHWNNALANQAVQALWLKHSDAETRDRHLSATVAAMIGIDPKDELEGMTAAQVIAAHNAAMGRWNAIAVPCPANRPSKGGARTSTRRASSPAPGRPCSKR